MKKIKNAVLFILLCSFYFSKNFGCIYNVRDVGFVDIMPAQYHLYYFIRNETPEELISAFEQISYSVFMDTNVEAEIINIDQKGDHPAVEYLHFQEIQSYPAAILVSPKGQSIVLPISAPGRPFRETLRVSLESVISSPKRKEILNNIISAYCIVLLIEGKDSAENKKAFESIANAAKKISGIMNQLPKHIDAPPHIIILPQSSFFKERILLWSLGVNYNETSKPQAAVLYGRGRKIGSLIEGEQSIGSNIFNILSVVGLSCECGLDKTWMVGTQFPLKWDEEIQSEVVKFLGFDAENPLVKMEMSSIMSLGFSPNTDRNNNIESSGNKLNEYMEGILANEVESSEKRVSPAQLRELTSAESKTSKPGINLKIILIIAGITILLIFAGSTFIFLRSHKRV